MNERLEMMHFEFATAQRIVFGPGRIAQAPAMAKAWGERVMIVTGRDRSRVESIEAALRAEGLVSALWSVAGEPTIEMLEAGREAIRAFGAQSVLAVGGGSVIDAGKALAALAANPGAILDYLEVVGRGQPITQRPLPLIAAPTTAGTGAEVTRNAVIGATAQRVKVSMRHAMLLPSVALVDPELTVSLSPDVTASTGLDALTQLIESFVSNQANPLTDGFCREGIARFSKAFRRAYGVGDDLEARSDMALAGLLSGLALANSKLGAVHGFAGPLGGMFPMAHGMACARLLPFVMTANHAALAERAPESPARGRLDDVGRLLTGRADAGAADGLAWLADLYAETPIPPLSASGMTEADIPGIVAQARQSSSMKGNPVTLSDAEMAGILAQAL